MLTFPLLAFAIAALGTYLVSRPGSALYILDHPTHRSLHQRPIPRSGGTAIVAALAVTAPLAAMRFGAPAPLGWIGAAVALVALVSFADDRFTLPVRYRLPVHLLAALLLLPGGLALARVQLPGVTWQLAGVAGAALAVLAVVWMLNLYNFMDGMDGNAGGMALIGFGALAVLGWRAGAASFAVVSACVAAAGAGFLLFNFPPARVFMGDTGSSTLGFAAGALSLWGARDGVFPIWAPVLVFSPFVADATVTLARRTLRGERVWEAHREHYYQRLVRAGLGHRITTLIEYAVMLACAASAIAAGGMGTRAQTILLVGWTVFYAVAFWLVGRIPVRTGPASAPVRDAGSAPAT